MTVCAEETPSAEVGVGPEAAAEVWDAVRRLYQTGLYPGIQVCVRREGILGDT